MGLEKKIAEKKCKKRGITVKNIDLFHALVYFELHAFSFGVNLITGCLCAPVDFNIDIFKSGCQN